MSQMIIPTHISYRFFDRKLLIFHTFDLITMDNNKHNFSSLLQQFQII